MCAYSWRRSYIALGGFVGRKADGLSLLFVGLSNLYILGWRHRRVLFDDGQSWNRSVNGAAFVSGENSARIATGVAFERCSHFCPIHAVFVDRRRIVCLLQPDRADAACAERRSHLSYLYCSANACGDLGTDDCGDSGCSHVKPERGVELAGIDIDGGFLSVATAGCQRGSEVEVIPVDDTGMGGGPAGPCHRFSRQRPRIGDRTVDSISSVGWDAGSISARNPDKTRKGNWHNDWIDCRVRIEFVAVATELRNTDDIPWASVFIPEDCVDLVC